MGAFICITTHSTNEENEVCGNLLTVVESDSTGPGPSHAENSKRTCLEIFTYFCFRGRLQHMVSLILGEDSNK